MKHKATMLPVVNFWYLFSGFDSETIRPSSELSKSFEEGQFLKEKLVGQRPAQLVSEVNGCNF